MMSVLSKRNIAILSVMATSYYLPTDWTKSHSRRQWPTVSQYPIIVRKAWMKNKMPFKDNWFQPFVAIKPAVHNTDPQQYPNGYEGPEIILGSGCIVDPSGLIVSACEGFGSASYVRVRFNNREVHEGRVVDRDIDTGLATILLDGNRNDWPVIEMFDTKTLPLPMGKAVYSVGNCLPGHYNHLYEGIIVRSDLNIEEDYKIKCELVQHTAVIKEGDCGNAVVDTNGKVLAINVKNFDLEINAAVPMHTVKEYIDRVKTKLSQRYGLLTYWYDPKDKDVFMSCGISKHQLKDYKGILVYGIYNKQLINAGISELDLITHINYKRVDSMDDLYCALQSQTTIKVWTNEPNYNPDPNKDPIILERGPVDFSEELPI
ncbi:uncharacterized protein LOC128955870 [Oppia nitens]|uniref:uncharacterized protein LOC128955870 n=1 Tax=Oppia nitens TaxID=1686743 RepID=UPI0023DACD26|nr:uncharacterized protein LOC128955870 [Oppia nitens]